MARKPRVILYDTDGLPYQEKFHESDKPKVYLSAGYGAGKTFSLCMKLFQLMDLNRGLAGGLLAPTTRMYKRDVYPTIIDICKSNSIPYRYNKSDMQWFFPDTASTLYVFHGEDDGASIKGPNLAFMLINEVTLISQLAFLSALARVRLKKAKRLQIAMSGTPEGFNWTYEYFIENPREDTDLIFGNSRLNIHNHQSYITNLEQSYDALMQEQYIDGKFVNLRGKRAAWAFDRMRHTDMGKDEIRKIPGIPVKVSVDFNVAPMAATLWQAVPVDYDDLTLNPTGVSVRAFAEVCIENSNTYELCDAIKEHLDVDEVGNIREEVHVYPDPAGRARSTKSRNTSDFDILREEGFTDLRYKPVISVRDCLNALNNAFSKDMIMINSNRCPQAVADLEQCVLKQDVFELDKKNPKRTHWLDGIKNFIEYDFPIRSRSGFRTERHR